jgi:hypothetical protein
MPTYWDAFMQEFREQVKELELVVILEAFFYFSKNQVKDCERILTQNK